MLNVAGWTMMFNAFPAITTYLLLF